jgi:hypothetical protein
MRVRQKMRGTRTISEMSEQEAEFIATAIDCDGSIAKSGSEIRIVVGQRDSEIAVGLAERFGGTLYAGPVKGKPFYRWILGKRESKRQLLKKILPHLKIRYRQAKLALELFDILDSKKPDWKTERARILAEISHLNSGLERTKVAISQLPGKID